jgi:hypothetical protein
MTTTTERIEWTQSGHRIIVEVTADGFTATIDGKEQDGCHISPPAPKQKSMFDARGAAGTIGALIVYTDRANELEAIRARLKAQKSVDPLETLRTLESNLRHAEYEVQAHHGNPTYTYHTRNEAKAALSAWIEAHTNLYEDEMARCAEVKAQRNAEAANTLIGRGED